MMKKILIFAALFIVSGAFGAEEPKRLSGDAYEELMAKAENVVKEEESVRRELDRLRRESTECQNLAYACQWQAERVANSALDASYYYAGYSGKLRARGDNDGARRMAICSLCCIKEAMAKGDEKALSLWPCWRLNGGRGLPTAFVWSGPRAKSSEGGHDVHPGVFQGRDPDPQLLEGVTEEDINNVDPDVERKLTVDALKKEKEAWQARMHDLIGKSFEQEHLRHSYREIQRSISDITRSLIRLQESIEKINEH